MLPTGASGGSELLSSARRAEVVDADADDSDSLASRSQTFPMGEGELIRAPAEGVHGGGRSGITSCGCLLDFDSDEGVLPRNGRSIAVAMGEAGLARAWTEMSTEGTASTTAGSVFAACANLQSRQRPFRRPCSQIDVPPHSLQMFRRRLCSQIDAPPHWTQWRRSLLWMQTDVPAHARHSFFRRPCSQIEEPLHCLHRLLSVLCSQIDEPPQSTHSRRRRPCSQIDGRFFGPSSPTWWLPVGESAVVAHIELGKWNVPGDDICERIVAVVVGRASVE
mmetsp:Transcript_44386/g.89102  ORF Transcript_44386/g.89102 Transcript_44386/m.89102 type:complete len:278 (-) Transcript_44386:21-854(-)